MLGKYICAGGFLIFLSACVVRDIQYVLKKEHQNNCNVHVFLMVHTKTINNPKNNQKIQFFQKENAKNISQKDVNI